MAQNQVRPEAPSNSVGFRLDDESLRVLCERAAKLKISRHELARFYLLQVLQEEQERTALHDAIVGLHRQLVQQREDALLAVEALLASAGKASEAEARTWIKENFA